MEKLSKRKATLLLLIGYCGEFPLELLRRLGGAYDYNRRLVMRLVQEGYLKERKFTDPDRCIVHSLSLTSKGMNAIRDGSPNDYSHIRDHLLSPADGQGDWKKTLRLHRHAHCLLTAMRIGADWRPGAEKMDAIGTQLIYFSAYEWNLLHEKDSKGSRACGIFFTRQEFFLVYYLGTRNLRWNKEVEDGFRTQIDVVADDHYPDIHSHFGGYIFLGKNWEMVENLISHGMDPRTCLIPLSRQHPMYYATDDRDGLLLLRAHLRYHHGHLSAYAYRQDKETYDHGEYDFDLWDLSRYYKPGLLSPHCAYIFPFQRKAMVQINRVNAEIRELPKEVLIQANKEAPNV